MTRMTLRERVLPAVVVSTTLAITVATWWLSTGGPFRYLSHYVPPGQTLFILSKLFALLAFTLLWLQCMTALTKHAPVLHGFFSLRPRHHALLGLLTFALVVLHIGLFIAASTLRTGHWAFDQLLPSFDSGYYKALISIGAIAGWLIVLVVVAGWLRMRGFVAFRWLHRAGVVVFALGFVHGVSIGSETRFGVMKYVYALTALSFGIALLSSGYAKFREYLRPSNRRSLKAPHLVSQLPSQSSHNSQG